MDAREQEVAAHSIVVEFDRLFLKRPHGEPVSAERVLTFITTAAQTNLPALKLAASMHNRLLEWIERLARQQAPDEDIENHYNPNLK